jgi:hypothetical protein
MSPVKNMGLERGPAADLWRNTLSQIPTTFGRLVYLTSLRDQNSGEYEHFGLEQVFGYEQAVQTLQKSHQDVFAAWLGLSLQEQKADLDQYLCGLETDPRAVIATWIRLSPYRNLAPAAAKSFERDLFISDVRALLETLKSEHGVASPDPDA